MEEPVAEQTILVCDACGKPAAETVTIRVSRGNFVKDLCASHVNELVSGARKPRPGRRKGVAVPSSGAKKTATRKPATRKPAAAKRRGRPRKKTA
jgi:hypothetical protein